MANVSIIGSGYIGTILGKALAKTGNKVIFYDINAETVRKLKSDGYSATTDIVKTIKETEISFVCVPTPTKNGKIDLNYIESATRAISNEMKNKDTYHIIAIKSTVLPLTTEHFVKPIIEESGKVYGKDFGLCSNPEFVTQVSRTTTDPELKKWYSENPHAAKESEDKAVIGVEDGKAWKILEELFKPLNIPIYKTDIKTAELVKYAHNLSLASRISFWNEIFLICKEFDIDSKKVAEIVSTDVRIGKYGTVHGKAFGGACLPKDLEAFITFAKDIKLNPKLLDAILDINKYMSDKYGKRE